jgi:hypothetical protein
MASLSDDLAPDPFAKVSTRVMPCWCWGSDEDGESGWYLIGFLNWAGSKDAFVVDLRGQVRLVNARDLCFSKEPPQHKPDGVD